MAKTLQLDQIKKNLAAEKIFLSNQFHVEDIGIFGSYTTGMQTPESDIDILVEFKPGHKDFFNYMRLKLHLENVLAARIDLVMRGAVKPQLRSRIMDQVVYV